MAFTQEKAKGKLPVVVGIGGNNTAEIIHKLQSWDLKEVAAVLSVSPYYSKPSQEGIYRHYAAIAKASPKPVILYNVPGRTNSNISAETTIRLANDFPGVIIGTKEASGNMVQCMHLVKNRPANFVLISGDDHVTMPLIACGFDGVISVVANAYQRNFANWFTFPCRETFLLPGYCNQSFYQKMDMLFVENNPAGVKCFLSNMGIIQNNLRLPLAPLSDHYARELKKLL